MEIKDGRIKPTSQREAKVFSRMAREQEAACMGDADEAAPASKGQWLPGHDSYKIFCAIERAIRDPQSRERETTKEELGVFEDTIRGLAQDHLDHSHEYINNFSLEASDHEKTDGVILMASKALIDRYDD